MTTIPDPLGLLRRRPELRQPMEHFARQAGGAGPGTPHDPNDSSSSFADGAAWAAHMLAHAVGVAHNRVDDRLLRAAIPTECCRLALMSYGAGFTSAMSRSYGLWTPHKH